ncbi:MAG: PAS domain-containing protein [Alphaproteobacteria bacterium]|nr:PAS domain-containing protein [Alphaproteobacteria bacterium]
MAKCPPSSRPAPTGLERPWTEDELIVSKTDTKGHITYANRVFLRIAQLTEDEALGAPHNIIRHPDMPRCVFKLLWDTVSSGKEIFAYVKNMAMNGDHYWVFAHVTPTLDSTGNITGYHSNRRKPTGEQVKKIAPIYHLLLDEERKHASPKDGLAASTALLQKFLKDKGIGYEEFVFTI